MPPTKAPRNVKLHLDLLLEPKADAIGQVFAIVAAHAGDVYELRIDPAREPVLARLKAVVQVTGDSRQLLMALLELPAVREATLLRGLRSPSG